MWRSGGIRIRPSRGRVWCGRRREIFFVVDDLRGWHVRKARSIGREEESGRFTQHYVMIVANRKSVTQDREIGCKDGRQNEHGHASAERHFPCAIQLEPECPHFRTNAPRSYRFAPTASSDFPSSTSSTAAATPLSEFERVIVHPRPNSSSDAFPMIKGRPAKVSISISL